MAKTTDPKSYAKNVLRSVGYITKETIKGVNPTLTSYITDTVSSTKDMYEHVKDFKRSFTGSMSDNTAFDDAKNIKNNIFDDIRSGKFYNPEREQKSLDAYMKSEGFSFDDFDMNDLDNEVEKDDNDNAPTRDVVERVGANIAISQQQMTAMSTEQITKGARSNTKASMAQNRQLFGMVNTSLASINGSILSLHNDLAQPLNNHITNSTTFFQFATGELAKQTSYLEKISKTLDERFAPSKGSGFKNRKTSAWEDIMSDGLPDLGKLVKNVKKRAWDDKGLGIISDFLNPEMLSMLSGTGGLSSPIATIATMALTSKLQNGATGKALNRTVDTMRSGFAHTAARISAYNASNWVETKNGKKNKNGFLGMLVDLLDITPKKNNKMDFGNYEKGRVDWNGMDDKALREVIPTQLASILSAITGQEAKIFNYKTGKWESANKITKDFTKDRNKNISNAIYGFRDDVTKEFISNANAEVGRDAFSENSRATLSFKSDFDTLMQLIAMSGKNPATITAQELDKMALSGTNKWVGENRPGQKQYPINLANYKRIKAIIFKQGSMNRARFSGAVIDAQLADNRFIQESGQGSFAQVANGSGLKGAKKNSIAGTIFDAKDDYGHNVFYYLQSYWKQLDTIKHYVSTGNFGAVAEAERGNGAKSNKPYVSRLRRSRETATATSTTGMATPFVNITDEGATDIKTSKGEWKPVSEFAGSNKTERKREEASSPISRGIDKINNFMAKLFLGEGVSLKDSIAKEGGLKAWITSLPSKISTGIVSAFTGLKDKIKGWFSKHFTEEGELGTRTLKSAKDIFKGFGKSIASHAVNTAGDAVEWFKGQRPDWASSTTAYKGGMVRKSGMVSVSEGELIIPSQYNPFYKGISNKNAQKFTEARNYRNWVARGSKGGSYWGSYAEGSTFVSQKDQKNLMEKTLDPAKKKIIDKFINRNGEESDSIAKIASILGVDENIIEIYLRNKKSIAESKKTVAINAKKAADTVESVKDEFSEAKDKAKDVVTEVKDKLLGGADRVAKALFGDEEKYAKAKDLGKSALDTIKADLPKTLASAGIGAIIGGALTGSGLGLLGGMVLGAGTMVIKNSDKINNFLFGSPDEDGNWSGGKIPPKMANFMKKRLPGMAKSGAIGGILGAVGLAPGGILGGLVIGAGVDLLAHNETVKNGISDALFGKEGVDGKRRGGIFGALQVNVVDPIANYVKDGLQKIGPYLKENFLDPVVKIFDPLKDWISGKAKSIGTKITDAVSGSVKRTVGEVTSSILGSRVVQGIGSAGKGLIQGAGWIASRPFQAVGTMADVLERHNVKKGYSRKSAADRVKLFEGRKRNAFTNNYNAELAALQESDPAAAEEYIKNFNYYANGVANNKRAISTARQDMADRITASLDTKSGSYNADVKAIKKLFNSKEVRANDFGSIADYVAKSESLDDATKKAINEYIGKAGQDIRNKTLKLEGFDQAQLEFFKQHPELGVVDKNGKINNRKLQKYRTQVGIDADMLKGADLEKWNKEQSARNEAKAKDELLKQQKQDDPLSEERNDLLTTIKNLLAGIAGKQGVSTKSTKKSNKQKLGLDADKIVKEEIAEGSKRQNPITGRAEEYRGGKWEEDYSDAETKNEAEEEKERNTLQTKFYSTVLGSGLLAGLSSLFGKKKDETGEKKQTLWDKIKDFVFGDSGVFGTNGFFSKIFGETGTIGKVFAGISGAGGLGSIIKGVFTSSAIKTVLTGAGLAWLFNKASDANAGNEQTDDNMQGYAYASEEEKKAMKQAAIEKQANMGVLGKTKHGMDSIENKLLGKNMSTYKKDDFVSEHTSNRINKKILTNTLTQGAIGAATNAVTGKLGTVGNLLNPVGLIKKTSEKILDVATDPKLSGTLAQSAAEKAANVIPCLKDKIIKVITWACQKLSIKGLGSSTDEIAGAIAKKMATASAKLAEVIPIVGWIIYGVQIVNAITVGAQSAGAKTILGILDEPTVSQRLLAAVANGINAAIPGVGGIIPTEWLVTIIYEVLSKCGVDFGNFAEQRENAKATIDQYNEENGTTYNIEEYLYNVLDQATVQNRVKQALKTGIVDTSKKAWEGIKSAGSSLVEGTKSLGSKISSKVGVAKDWVTSKATSIGSGIKSAAQAAGGWVKDKTDLAKTWASEKVGAAKDWATDKLTSAKNGIIGIGTSIATGAKGIASTIGSKITSGVDYIKEAKNAIQDLQTRVGATFNDPEKGMRDIESIEVNISDSNPLAGATRSVAGVTKIITTASLFVGAIGKKIYNSAIKPIIDTAKTTVKDTFNTVTSALKCAATGDFEGLYANESVSTDESNPIGFVSKIANIGAKVLLTPLTTVAWTGKKIKETFMKVVEIGKQWNASGANSLDAAKELMNTGSISELWNMNSNNNEEGFWGTLSNIQDFIAKVAYTIPTAAIGVGIKIKEGFEVVKSAASRFISSGVDSVTTASTAMKAGSLSDLWTMNSNENDEGIWGTVSNLQDLAAKFAFSIPTAAVGVGIKIKEGFNAIKAAGTQFISSGLDSIETAKSHMMSGSLSDLWSMNSNENDEGIWGTISNVQDVAAKVAFSIPTAAVGVGGKIKETFEFIKGKVISCAESIVSTNDSAKQFSSTGDLSGLWGINSNQDGENPLGFISNITDTLFKFAYTPSTVIKAAGNKITEIFTNVKSSIPDVKSMITDLWSYTDPDKDISGYDTAMSKYKNEGSNDVYGTIGNVIATVLGGAMKPIVSVVRIGKTIGESIGNIIGGVKEWVGDKVEGVKNWGYDKLDSLKSWALGDTGTGSGIHVSQKGNRKFGRSTIGANGCGPAAAATVLRAYGRNSDLDSAASFAEANGYVAGASGVGTRASYFSDIFGSNGIKSSYTQSKASMQGAISSGRPTVLLGQDRSNHSKANSPFGPNPHYVVARGTDSRGNIVVDDPELNKSALYKKDILKSARLGVMTGGDSGINIKESDGAVWNYLKSAGLNDYGAAGLMGNLYAESGITFNKVEGSSIKKSDAQSHDYSRDHGFSYDSASYTSAVDKGIAQGLQGSPDQNAKPTFGVVPKYEFTHMPWKTTKQKPDGTYWGQNGYGLVQWTTAGRKEGLYNLAVANKKSISDPETQLAYLLQELNGSYTPVLSILKNAKSVKEASNKVLIDFEAPATKNQAATQNLRASYGQAYYDQFTKNPPKNTSFGSANVLATANIDTSGMSGSTGTDSSSGTSSSSSFSLSSILSDTFGRVFKGVAEKVGGVGGKILNLITGGLISSTGTENNGGTGSTNTVDTSQANMGGVATSTSNTTQENAIVSKMNSILGTCSYSMSGARNPEKGSADCSSTVQWVLKKTIGKDPGGDTDSILNSSNGTIVDKYSSGDPLKQNSSGPNLNNLRPGDLLLYSRPTSGYTEGRKFRVGHVEMYMGDGKRAGHGSGTGPKVTDATSDSNRYIMAKRYTDATATGSGIPLYDFTKGDAFKGGASALTAVDATGISRNNDQNAQLAQILLYTKQIASNTGFNASIPTIVEVLRTYGDVLTQINAGGSASTAVNNQKSDTTNTIQTDISSMMAKLDAIASTL